MKFDLLIIITAEILRKYKTNLYVLQKLVPYDEMVLVGDSKAKELIDADKELQLIGSRFIGLNDLAGGNEDIVIQSYGAKTNKNYMYWDIRFVPTKVFIAFEDEHIYIDDTNGEELSHLMIDIGVMRETLKSGCSIEEAFDCYWAVAAEKYPDLYIQRESRVFEKAGAFVRMEELSDNDLSWLSLDYDMLFFSEQDKLLPEYSSFFYNVDYRNRLRASQICEVIRDDMNNNSRDEAEKISKKSDSSQRDLTYESIRNQLLSDVDFVGELSDKLLKVVSIFGPHNRIHLSPLCEMQNAMFNTMSGEIYVGDNTFCGSNVSIITGNHDVRARGRERMNFTTTGNDIEIGNGVWLCSNAVILGPCQIKDNAVVAAGSVVLPGTVIGENELWAGIPAVFKKKI